MNERMRIFLQKFFMLAFCGFFAFIHLGCHRKAELKDQKFSGTLEYTEHLVGARVHGRLTEVLFDEGQTLKAGQILALLDRHDQAQRDYERLKTLVKQGGATEQSAEQAKLAWEDQKILAPIDGVVLTKVHETGEVVSAGSPLLVLGNPEKKWVKIYIPEGMIHEITLEKPVQVYFDGVAEPVRGHVSFISPQAEFTPRNVQTEEERVTQTFGVKVTLDEQKPFLRPGIPADVLMSEK